jgi:hypothetical protein
MKAIQLISNDLFDKIRSRFQNLEMGDETGAITIDPSEARFFDFDFVNEGIDLGRVSISLNDLGSLKIYYSQGITENQDDMSKKVWYNFLKEMRLFAMRRLLRFDTRDIAKNNLDRNDFQFLAAKGPKEDNMTMNESRWNSRSTKKTSRAVKGTTEVIVRHTESMDETFPGARSMPKKIKAIFIQNKDGERFKYPFIHPAGAFAMAQHVDNGGVPHDPAGKAIVNMSEQIAQLQAFQRKVGRTQLHPDAMGISERAQAKLQELKRHIDMLGKRHHYLSWKESMDQTPMDDGPLTELDPVQMEQYKQTFTQTSFQEELSAFFPLLHRIMSEADAVDLEDYVKEEEAESAEDNDSDVKENAFEQFESWAEAVEQGKLTPDEIQELKQAIEQLPQGEKGPVLDLTLAYNFFNEYGIDDNNLRNAFQDEQKREPEIQATSMQVFQTWANQSYPELLVALGMSDTQAPAEPAPAPAEPAPEQPVAEAPEDRTSYQVAKVLFDKGIKYNSAKEGELVKAIGMVLVKELEMTPKQARGIINDEDFLGDTLGELQHMAQSENTDMVPPPGAMEESADPKEMVKEVAKIVKSFYNRDNPEVGPFRGEEGIVIDVEKQISEKFGEEAGKQAGQMAEAFMKKLTQEWQQNHGNNTVPAEEGLGTKILGGAALLASLWGVNNHLANQAYEASPQLQKLTQFYKQAEANQDVSKMKELKRRIEDHKARLDLGYGDVMDKTGNPKEIVPEMADILKLAGLAK